MKMMLLVLTGFLAADAWAMGKAPEPTGPNQWICEWSALRSPYDPTSPRPALDYGCGNYRDSRAEAEASASVDCRDSEVLSSTCRVYSCRQGRDGFCAGD